MDTVSGGDVGDGPASLLLDSLLWRVEQGAEARKNGDVDDDLGLVVITSHDVTDSAEGGGLYGVGIVEKELDHLSGDTSFDDGLDSLVRSVGQVGEGPASISEDLVVGRIDETG